MKRIRRMFEMPFVSSTQFLVEVGRVDVLLGDLDPRGGDARYWT